MKKVGFWVILVIFSGNLLWAQDEPALTLQDCIEIALKNNSQLRNAERRVEMAGTSVTTAMANLLPHINASLGSYKYVQGARVLKQDVPIGFDPITGRVLYQQREIFQDRTERNSHSARVSLSQNVYDFGQTINAVKQVKASESAEQHSLISTKQTVILNVKKAYYELLKAYRLQEVYQEAVSLAQEQVNRAQAMFDIGLASQAEVFQAKVTLGSNQMNLITQQNLVEMAHANLNNALGRNPSTPFKLIEDKTEPIFPDYQFEDAVNTAISSNQDIKTLELQAKAYMYSIRAAKARYMPSIGASVSYSRNNDDYTRVYSSELNRDFSATLGIGLDLNIFNGFSDQAAVQRESLNYQTAMENLAERKRTVTAEVKQYFLQFNAYKEILDINRQNIEAAKENLRLQLEKRRVGSGTELDVAQAQVELTRAQSNLVQAEYDAKISKAQLEAVMGQGKE